MRDLIIVSALSAFGGGLIGALVGRVVRRPNRDNRPQPEPESWLRPEVSDEYDLAASAWAEAHDRPEGAPLLASKLRLADRLNARQDRRWRS